VLEVKVGHRWVVSFNLAVDQDVPIPIAQDRLDRKLQAALVGWVQEIAGRESHLVCPLEHKYTEANLDLKSMKGDDRARLDNLVGLSPQLNLDIFFATIEKMQMGTPYWSGYGGHYGGGYGKRSGWYDEYDEEDEEEEDQEEKHSGEFHDIEEVVDTQYEMKLVKDIGGRQVASSLVLDTDCLAEGEGAFLEDTPDEEDYEEYMGNSVRAAAGRFLAAIILTDEGLGPDCDSLLPLIGLLPSLVTQLTCHSSKTQLGCGHCTQGEDGCLSHKWLVLAHRNGERAGGRVLCTKGPKRRRRRRL